MPEDPQDVRMDAALSAKEEAEMEALLSANARVGACPAPALLFAAMEDVLPPPQQTAIRAHAERCTLCQSLLEVAQQEEPLLTPSADARIRARMKNQLEAKPDTAQPRVVAMPLQRPNAWRIPLGIAAAVVLALAGTMAYRARRAEVPLPQAAAQPATIAAKTVDIAELHTLAPLPPPTDVPQMITRGEAAADEPSTADLLPAFRAYNRGEYTSAAAEFTKLRTRFPHSDIVLTYLGVSQLQAGDNAAAQESLTAAQLVAKPARRDAAAWYLAVADLRAGEKAGAAPLFDGLCHGQSAYREQACAISAKLR